MCYFRPNFTYHVDGWVRKWWKICLRNKSMVPKDKRGNKYQFASALAPKEFILKGLQKLLVRRWNHIVYIVDVPLRNSVFEIFFLEYTWANAKACKFKKIMARERLFCLVSDQFLSTKSYYSLDWQLASLCNALHCIFIRICTLRKRLVYSKN